MYLFNKENIWSNPHSCNNNSVNRIISKEEEREDPRRDSSIYLRVQIQWCFHIQSSNSYKNYKDLRIQCILQELQCFHTQSSNSAYRIYSSTRNTTTTRLIPCHPVQAPSSNCFPCLQAFYTAEQGSYSTPSAPYTSRLPVILPGRNSILHGSQHPRSPYSSSQAKFYITEFYQDSFQKGQVLYVHAILRSGCSNLLILV